MRTLLAVSFLLVMPAVSQAQPSGWAASTGASAPEAPAPAPAPVIEITRPVNAPQEGQPVIRAAEAACEIKPVMSDADYRRCNTRPPNYDVDFAAPWPAGKPIAGQRRPRG